MSATSSLVNRVTAHYSLKQLDEICADLDISIPHSSRSKDAIAHLLVADMSLYLVQLQLQAHDPLQIIELL